MTVKNNVIFFKKFTGFQDTYLAENLFWNSGSKIEENRKSLKQSVGRCCSNATANFQKLVPWHAFL